MHDRADSYGGGGAYKSMICCQERTESEKEEETDTGQGIYRVGEQVHKRDISECPRPHADILKGVSPWEGITPLPIFFFLRLFCFRDDDL